MSSSKSCIIMHDDDNNIKTFGSNSNMNMIMHDDEVRCHGYVFNSKSLAKGNSGYEDGDGDDDDDDDGGYDFAPAA
ncbi:hypothetical protein REPUB_Repub18cG0085200 [Reevesia pubescens]